MNIGIADIRKALENGPMTRDELAAHFRCARGALSKPLYNLISTGAAAEEGEQITLIMPDEENLDMRPPLADRISGWLRKQEREQDQNLRDAVALLVAELPGLLEDREKLRKLRELIA